MRTRVGSIVAALMVAGCGDDDAPPAARERQEIAAAVTLIASIQIDGAAVPIMKLCDGTEDAMNSRITATLLAPVRRPRPADLHTSRCAYRWGA